jgi:hypothetical protein
VRTVDRERRPEDMGVRFYRSDYGQGNRRTRHPRRRARRRPSTRQSLTQAVYTGAVFVETMEKEGIKFDGRVRRARENEPNAEMEWTELDSPVQCAPLSGSAPGCFDDQPELCTLRSCFATSP